MTIKHYQITSPQGLQDLPLPGFYPCLTWQLNVTVHQQSGLGKFVSVVREPNDHIEVVRSFADLSQWSSTVADTQMACAEALRALGYLSGLTNGV